MNLKGRRKAFFTYLGRKPKLTIKKEMIDITNKDICQCGHVQTLHKNRSTFCVGDGWRISNKFCPCIEYRPKDNLKYLESRYEKLYQGC